MLKQDYLLFTFFKLKEGDFLLIYNGHFMCDGTENKLKMTGDGLGLVKKWDSNTNHISIVFWTDTALVDVGFELRVTSVPSIPKG